MLVLADNEVVGAAADVARSGRPLFRRAMHWVRRIHLYSGLFMFPWVMLYGMTALLFNHPDAFPDCERRSLSREDFSGTALEKLANPAADAEHVVAALNTKPKTSESTRKTLRLVHPDLALYSRDVIVAKARGAGQEHSVLLDLPSGTATMSSSRQDDVMRPAFAVRGLTVPGALSERVKTGLPEALTRLKLSADDAGISIGADLVFFVDDGERVWRTTYNIQTGAVTGRPAEAPSDYSLRRFLTRLHLTHGFPSVGGARWMWAVAVDAMFVSMIFWGVSGLFMWWQIKAVRIAGIFLLAGSLIIATLLGYSMHQIFTAS